MQVFFLSVNGASPRPPPAPHICATLYHTLLAAAPIEVDELLAASTQWSAEPEAYI